MLLPCNQVLWIPNADYAALNTKPAKSAAANSAADSATLHTGGDGKQASLLIVGTYRCEMCCQYI